MKNIDTNCFHIYVLEYKSDSFEIPLYLIWYTDNDVNEIDKLLTSGSSKIVCLSKFNKEIVESYFNWIDKPLNIVDSIVLYDITKINNNLSQEVLDDNTIEIFVDFINLFGDFVYQDNKNLPLKVYIEDKSINYVWQYFYDYIFWPKFHSIKIDRPRLCINYNHLQDSFNRLISIFEQNLEVVN